MHQLGVQPHGIDEPKCASRIRGRHDDGRRDLFAARELHTGDGVVFHDDLRDLGAGPNDRAVPPRERVERRDERVGTVAPPCARPHRSGRCADEIVKQDERRAARARSLPDVANAAGADRRLERLGFELVVEQILDRHRHDAQQLRHVLTTQCAELAAETEHGGEVGERRRVDVRRGTLIELAEKAGQLAESRDERPPAVGVAC